MIVLLICIIAGMALEGIVLLAYHHRTGQGVPPKALLPNLCAGALLLLATALAIGGVAWPWLCFALSGAGLGHAADLRLRWIKTP